MRTHLTLAADSPSPLGPVRVLVEDPLLVDASPPMGPFEVTVCSGPDDETEACPLVLDGACPLGAFDVVVGALRGPWGRSVRAAWCDTSTPYVDVGASVPPDPSRRLDHHIGAALQLLFTPGSVEP